MFYSVKKRVKKFSPKVMVTFENLRCSVIIGGIIGNGVGKSIDKAIQAACKDILLRWESNTIQFYFETREENSV